MTGIATVATPHRRIFEELVELLQLAVRQRVHRIDDDRLDSPFVLMTQRVIDDRNDIRQALTAPRAGRQDVALARAVTSDRVRLVAVEGDRSPVDLEARFRLGGQDSFLFESFERVPLRKRGAELKEGLGPQNPGIEPRFNLVGDLRVFDIDVTVDKVLVLIYDLFAQSKNVHWEPSRREIIRDRDARRRVAAMDSAYAIII